MAKESYRNARRQNFTQVNNEMLNDPNLTLQEKGLLSIFLSNSQTFDIHMKEIITRSKNGRDAHYNVINNLIENGYFARVEILDKETKVFKELIYIFSDSKEDVLAELEQFKDDEFAIINRNRKKEKVSEKTTKTPVPENQDTDKNPVPENQDTENTDTENQDINNNKYKNTKYKNTKNNNNTYQSKQKKKTTTYNKRNRTEIVPEWIKDKDKPKQEEQSQEFLERKARLQARLKEKYKKKNAQ